MSDRLLKSIERQGDIENFLRFEFKYLLNRDRATLIRNDIEQFMSYDGHIGRDGDQNYYVRSLYFDNVRRENFYEKIDGIKSRRKYRLRTYTSAPNAKVPIYLEEKNRLNNRVFKFRTQLAPESLAALETGADILQQKEVYGDNLLFDRFASRHLLRGERTVVMVDYFRRAFVSNYDVNFRVTLDSDIQAAPSKCLFGEMPNQRVSCMAGYTIMEIKFSRRVPSWFHRILQSYQLQRISISKYCKAMEACGLAVDLS